MGVEGLSFRSRISPVVSRSSFRGLHVSSIPPHALNYVSSICRDRDFPGRTTGWLWRTCAIRKKNSLTFKTPSGDSMRSEINSSGGSASSKTWWRIWAVLGQDSTKCFGFSTPMPQKRHNSSSLLPMRVWNLFNLLLCPVRNWIVWKSTFLDATSLLRLSRCRTDGKNSWTVSPHLVSM